MVYYIFMFKICQKLRWKVRNYLDPKVELF